MNYIEKINQLCNCNLKIPHGILDHDWCCQICGGDHTEVICPFDNPYRTS